MGKLASLAAALMAGVGALPLVLIREASQRLLNVMFGFATKAMLAATEFSLIQPNVEEAGGSAVFVHFFGKRLPLKHFIQGQEGSESGLSGIWLFVLAITLHNFPEGLAVGVGFGQGGEEGILNGLTLAVAIGLQDAPEGLAVAASLLREGYGAPKAIWIATLAGAWSKLWEGWRV